MRVAAGGFEQFIQVLGVGGKPLLVVWFAPKSGDRDVIDARMRAERGQQQQPKGEFQPPPPLRRSSHSAAISSSSHRNTTGMFHSSLMSRTEMPASEYEISLGSRLSSPGLQ